MKSSSSSSSSEELEDDDNDSALSEDGSSSSSSSSESESEILNKVKRKRKKLLIISDGSGSSSTSDDDISEDRCPICLYRFKKQLIGIPNGGSCTHRFCLDCIREWSQNVNTCPIDRSEFNEIIVKAEVSGPEIRREKLEKKAKGVEEVEIFDDEREVFCEICRSGHDEERLLLCDGCDLGFHTRCLTPPLTAVPRGRWYCPTCSANGLGSSASTSALEELVMPRTMANERLQRRVLHRRRRRRQPRRRRKRLSTSTSTSKTGKKTPKKRRKKRKLTKKQKRKNKRQKKKEEQKNNSAGIQENGLSLFGDPDELNFFGDDNEEEEDPYANPQPGTSNLMDRSDAARILHQQGKKKVKALENIQPEESTDLLSEIMFEQSTLTAKSSQQQQQTRFDPRKEIYSKPSSTASETLPPPIITTITSRTLLLQKEVEKARASKKSTSTSSTNRTSSSSSLSRSSSASMNSNINLSEPSSSSSSSSSSSGSVEVAAAPRKRKSAEAVSGLELFKKPKIDAKAEKEARNREKLRQMEVIGGVVKKFLKPYYARSKISKEEYKSILRRSVEKIYSKVKDSDEIVIEESKVQRLVVAYVAKYRS